MCILRKNGMAFGVLISLALLIHGCGSGGAKEGDDPPSGTATQSASAASKAIVSVLGVAISNTGGVAKPSLKAASPPLSDTAQVRRVLHDFKVSLAARRQKTLQAVIDSGVLACPNGGTQRSQLNDNNTPNDGSDDSLTGTFVDCSRVEDGLSIIQNGVFNITLTDSGFKMTFSNFVIRTKDSSGSVEITRNGSMVFSGSEARCGDEFFLENGTFKMDLSSTTRVDFGSNGSDEINESTVLNNLRMTIAEAYEPACTLSTTTFAMNGRAVFTNHIDELENFKAVFTHFTMTTTPSKRTIGGTEVAGDRLSLDGTIAITSDCVNGTFIISTPVGQEPFVPLEEACPADGKFLITRDGTVTSVTFTPIGAVQINEGDDNLIEATFPNCRVAEACV